MDTNKPTFDSLSPEQVNDLIATKVMGCEIREEGIYKRGPVTDPTEISAILYNDQKFFPPQRYFAGEEAVYFNPFHSLDDCWKAEEKMLSMNDPEPVRWGLRTLTVVGSALYNSYTVILSTMIDPDPIMNLDCIQAVCHATAAQKCEAMLRAIGEVA